MTLAHTASPAATGTSRHRREGRRWLERIVFLIRASK
jgi:hypothetical protein